MYEDLTAKKNEIDKYRPFPDDLKEKIKRIVLLETISSGNCFEGGSLTPKEIESILFKDEVVPEHTLTEHIQAINIAKAVEFVYELAQKKNRPSDENDVKNIHRVLVQGLDDRNAGMYRGKRIKFPFSDKDLPDNIRIHKLMDDFGMWLYTARTLHPVSMAAEAHLKFQMIQPFAESNGDVARMILNLVLMKYDYPPVLFSRREVKEYWSNLQKAIFDQNREDYDKMIHRVVNRTMDYYLKILTTKSIDIISSDPYFLKIGQLAKECGERVSTIRYWTNMGLIEPVKKTSSDYMIFSSDILKKIEKIKNLKKQRLTLDEIKQQLKMEHL
ncbi:MAG: MerR family transcriptional regulator [Alphaproteobacteria bacterium]|nr:MerR family transcriptional regulator [Alphaproteobacteria bacterium]